MSTESIDVIKWLASLPSSTHFESARDLKNECSRMLDKYSHANRALSKKAEKNKANLKSGHYNTAFNQYIHRSKAVKAGTDTADRALSSLQTLYPNEDRATTSGYASNRPGVDLGTLPSADASGHHGCLKEPNTSSADGIEDTLRRKADPAWQDLVTPISSFHHSYDEPDAGSLKSMDTTERCETHHHYQHLVASVNTFDDPSDPDNICSSYGISSTQGLKADPRYAYPTGSTSGYDHANDYRIDSLNSTNTTQLLGADPRYAYSPAPVRRFEYLNDLHLGSLNGFNTAQPLEVNHNGPHFIASDSTIGHSNELDVGAMNYRHQIQRLEVHPRFLDRTIYTDNLDFPNEGLVGCRVMADRSPHSQPSAPTLGPRHLLNHLTYSNDIVASPLRTMASQERFENVLKRQLEHALEEELNGVLQEEFGNSLEEKLDDVLESNITQSLCGSPNNTPLTRKFSEFLDSELKHRQAKRRKLEKENKIKAEEATTKGVVKKGIYVGGCLLVNSVLQMIGKAAVGHIWELGKKKYFS